MYEPAGFAERWGQTVLYCPYCHGYEVQGERLGVLSVMPQSTHQALLISDWGYATYFLKGGLPPDAGTLAKFAERKITVEPAPILGLAGGSRRWRPRSLWMAV